MPVSTGRSGTTPSSPQHEENYAIPLQVTLGMSFILGLSSVMSGCGRTELTIIPNVLQQAPIVSIWVGLHAVCAIDADGKSYCDGFRFDDRNVRSVASLVDASHREKSWHFGENFTCRIDLQNQLFCVGANENSQLGAAHPARLEQWTLIDSEVKKIDSVLGRTCVLYTSGAVRCRGRSAPSAAPIEQQVRISNARDIAMLGNALVCVLDAESVVSCVGKDTRLGDIPAANYGRIEQDGTLVTQRIPAWTNVRAIDSGGGRITATHTDGAASWWGNHNLEPNLPNRIVLPGTEIQSRIAGVRNVVQTVSGAGTICVRNSSGEVFCMGSARFGQLGDGSQTTRAEMGRVDLPEPVTVLRAFRWAFCALGEQVHCWGTRIPLTLRFPQRTAVTRPTPLFAAVQAMDVQLGLTGGYVQNEVGSVFGWASLQMLGQPPLGENSLNFVGSMGVDPPLSVTPVPLSARVRRVIPQLDGGAAILADGSVVNWGGYGVSPQPLQLPEAASTIVSRGHTLIVQMESGTTVRFDPDPGMFSGLVIPSIARPQPLPSWTGATSISATLSVACAVTRVGSIECFGSNAYGGLGQRNREFADEPISVPLPRRAISVQGGTDRMCAILEGADVYCWGSNATSQLGSGPGKIIFEPIFVGSLSPAIDVAAGSLSTCAVSPERTVRCLGSNVLGAVGLDVGPIQVDSPQVLPLTNIDRLEVSDSSFCAIRAGALPQCWGSNLFNEFGLDSPPFDTRPVVVRFRD